MSVISPTLPTGYNWSPSLVTSHQYGIEDMDSSPRQMYTAASRTPEDYLIIFPTHNGPTGLGAEANDICGVDWVFRGGGHGDLDEVLIKLEKFCVSIVGDTIDLREEHILFKSGK